MASYKTQPSRGVPGKRCSKNIQQIYRRTPIPKTTLLKSHFGMGVLLQICCIFSAHLFLRTPLEDCFWSYKKIKYLDILRFPYIKCNWFCYIVYYFIGTLRTFSKHLSKSLVYRIFLLLDKTFCKRSITPAKFSSIISIFSFPFTKAHVLKCSLLSRNVYNIILKALVKNIYIQMHWVFKFFKFCYLFLSIFLFERSGHRSCSVKKVSKKTEHENTSAYPFKQFYQKRDSDIRVSGE